MLKIYNTLSKKIEPFHPVNQEVVNVFTCGPSVYQRAHIGNFRTFLFEDVLVRYLQYLGYRVQRGMIFTDLEDKAIVEAERLQVRLRNLTTANIRQFLQEMKLLGMQIPDYLPRASDCVASAVTLIECLLRKGIAYRHRGNIYFDPLKFPGFGKLYGLDMSHWPKKRKHFHKDTYPGVQWNLGDFILWHGCQSGDKYCWETAIGPGRPSWNIQDPSVVSEHFHETLSIYCGGIDNLYRHHDYSLAILESVHSYPMSAYWLHCHHLYVQGRKMSKSKGNIYYTDTILSQGYGAQELRFFLIYNHYRSRVNYTANLMLTQAAKLREVRKGVQQLRRRAGKEEAAGGGSQERLRQAFTAAMDDDLDVKEAFDSISQVLRSLTPQSLTGGEAAGVLKALRGIDSVLQVLF